MLRRFIIAGVVVLLLIIAIFWALGRRNSRPQQDVSVKVQSSSLVNYADTTTEMRYTLEGVINAREEHRAVQVTVGQNYRTATIYDGYQGNVLKTQTLQNDQDAYRSFLAALQNLGYTRTQIAAKNVEPLGVCPKGQRYHYDIINGSDTQQSLWSTSCTGTKGTFAGSATNVRSLFQAQIPNYKDFVQGVQF